MNELNLEGNAQLTRAMTQLIEAVRESVDSKQEGPDVNRLLSPKDVAVLLGVSLSQARNIFREGDLPIVALPSSGVKNKRHQYRVRYGALVDWILKRENDAK